VDIISPYAASRPDNRRGRSTLVYNSEFYAFYNNLYYYPDVS